MWELGLVAFGTVLGAVLTFVTSYWTRLQQRGDADRDWHRNNQRDIDWQAQDFVIEVQAFANDWEVERLNYRTDPFSGQGTTTSSRSVFNSSKSIELNARANAFEARVKDPELKSHIQDLNTELLLAHRGQHFGKDNLATVHAHCQKFYQRVAKLYGDPTRQTNSTQEQPLKVEYRAAAEPVAVEPAQPDS